MKVYSLGSPYHSWDFTAIAERAARATGNPSGSASWPDRLAAAAAREGVQWDTGFDRITVPDSWTYAETLEFIERLMREVPAVVPLERMLAGYQRRAATYRQEGDHARANVMEDMARYVQELMARGAA